MDAGSSLGPYEILRLLGVGGMGEVYLARDTRLDREVALKILPDEVSADPSQRARFRLEARLAATLNHPHIATIFGFEEIDGVTAIAMERVEGETLEARLARGPVPVETALDLAEQVADALAAAHRKGVLHRDLKPSNVMISGGGDAPDHLKILDFGLAKALARDDISGADADTLTSPMTALGALVGTPPYMSPEQARGEPAGRESDVWAFGCLLFEMLTGHRAFSGKSQADLLGAILHREPDWEELPAALPDAVARLLRHCLTKDRHTRPSGMPEVRTALVEARSRTQRDAQQSRGLGLGAIGAAVVLAGLGILWLRWNGRTDVRPPHIGRSTPLTSEPGLELDPAISPDGKLIAYAAGRPGEMDVFVRQVVGGTAINLTTPLPGDHRWPQWSADGTQVAFLSSLWTSRGSAAEGRAASATIHVVPALGGQIRPLIDPTSTETLSPAAYGIAMGSEAWSPDGAAMAYTQGDGIYVQPLDGGELVVLGRDYLPHSLRWSPDGRFLAYVAGNPEFVFGTVTFGNAAPSAIKLLPLAGGPAHDVTGRASLNVSPTWLPDQDGLLFVSNREGTRDVYLQRLQSSSRPLGEPVRLSTGLGAHGLSLAPAGDVIYASLAQLGANVYSLPIPAQGEATLSQAVPVTSGNQSIEGMSVSLDGDWLAFDSNRGGDFDIYKQALAGGEPQRLTTNPADDFTPAWSVDGEWVAFHSFRNGSRDIYLVSADGRTEQQVTDEPYQERFQTFSADGDTIAFHSDRSGSQQLYVISRRDGAWSDIRQLTNDNGTHPRWSPDGRWIAYLILNEGSLCVVSPDGSGSRVLVHSDDAAELPAPAFAAWSGDGTTVYYKAFDQNQVPSFWAVSVEGGPPRRLATLDDPAKPSPRPEFTAGDGRLFFTVATMGSDLWSLALEGR